MAPEVVQLLIPLGRLGERKEIAAAALFLASDESSCALGNDLVMEAAPRDLTGRRIRGPAEQPVELMDICRN